MKTKTLIFAVLALTFAACQTNQKEKENQTMKTNEECLICGAPLEYLTQDVMMECVICHKQEPSKTRCVEGHYVCNRCHTSGMDSIIATCME